MHNLWCIETWRVTYCVNRVNLLSIVGCLGAINQPRPSGLASARMGGDEQLLEQLKSNWNGLPCQRAVEQRRLLLGGYPWHGKRD